MTVTEQASVDAAIAELTTVCRAAHDADKRLEDAYAARHDAARQHWPVLYRLGAKRISQEVGPELISSAMVRTLTEDLEPRPARGPRFGVTVTPEERAAIDDLRTACAAVNEALPAQVRALNDRHYALRRLWPVVGHLGATRLERLIGAEYVGESTIRSITADLRRGPGDL